MWKRFISGEIYRDIPTPLLFIVGPLLGLVYLCVLPAAWVLALILAPIQKARKIKTKSLSVSHPNP